MEAGGFEPPSRDTSRQASTCLVDFLSSRLIRRQSTGFRLDQSVKFRFQETDNPSSYPAIRRLHATHGKGHEKRAAI